MTKDYQEAINNAFRGIVNRASRPPDMNPGDYTKEGIIYCGTCNQPKQRWFCLPDEPPEAARLVRISCECQQKAEAEAAAERERYKAANQVKSARRDSYIHEPSFDRISLNNDDKSNPAVAELANRYLAQWSENVKNGIGILFYGSVGSGKTYYAAGIANRLAEQGIWTAVGTVPGMVSAMQAGHQQEVLRDLRRFALVVLDDFGAERDSSYGLEQVYQIVSIREATGKPTIITTNLPISVLNQQGSGQTDVRMARIYDRVMSMGQISVQVTGDSVRMTGRKEKQALARDILFGEAKK